MTCPYDKPGDFDAYGIATHIAINQLMPGGDHYYVAPTCMARKQAQWSSFRPEWAELEDHPVIVYYRHGGESHHHSYFSPQVHGSFDDWDEMLAAVVKHHKHREKRIERHFAEKEQIA